MACSRNTDTKRIPPQPTLRRMGYPAREKMKSYLKQFIKEEQGGETLEWLVVLAVAAGVIAIGVAVMQKGNGKLSNFINTI